jgi:dephospho-CoA kinase
MSNILQIGVTGGIASGKSTVCQIFMNLGVPVYDADSRAKWLMVHDISLKDSIQREFGPESYKTDGQIDKLHLGKAFSDPKQLAILNELIHPVVGLDYRKWVSTMSHEPYLVKEAALLFESGSYKFLDKIITVFCPESIRVQRVLKRDPHRTKQQVQTIIDRQLSEDEKLKKADYIIYNDDKHLLITQVLKLHQEFLFQAAQV